MRIHLTIPLFLLLACCPDREGPGLPPITSEGKNTFGCRINGEVYVADGSGTDQPNKGIYAVLESKGDSLGHVLPIDSCSLIISTKKSTNTIFLFVNPYLKIGSHALNLNTYEYPIVVHPFNYSKVVYSGKTYQTSSVDTGYVYISKWDQKKFIISGKFEFKARNINNRKDTINVTDGRFDLDYSKTH